MENLKLRNISARRIMIENSTMILLEDPEHFSPAPLVIPDNEAMIFILACLNGDHSARDIQADFMRNFGTLLMSEQLNSIIKKLDENHFLDNENFHIFRESVINDYLESRVRKPFHAGSTYPADEEDVAELLDSMLAEGNPVSPEMEQESPVRPRAIIAPHIDFFRGERVYGSVYKCLPEGAPPDLIVILGTLHAPVSSLFIPTRKAFETPLGLAETDVEILDALEDLIPPDELYADEFSHRAEHSIEFQVLWLQYIYRHSGPVTILPVLCSSLGDYVESGKSPAADEAYMRFPNALKKVLAESGKEVLFVVGADFSHIGPAFGDAEMLSNPFLMESRREDQQILDAVSVADAEQFFSLIAEQNDRYRVCGLPPIYALLNMMDDAKGTVVDYEQSVDEQGTTSVSFAGVVFH